MNSITTSLLLLLALLVTSCASKSAGFDSSPAIGGYCPVSYFTEGQAVKGSPALSADYAGKEYHFATEQARATFRENPTKYLPAYDGWCAYGVASGQRIQVNPEVFSIVEERLYLNKNHWVGRSFEKKKATLIAQADQQWPRLASSAPAARAN